MMPSSRSPSQISAYTRNLAHRLEKPAQGNGRIQKAALRALWAHEGTATTAQVAEWAYCRKLEIEKGRLTKSEYRHIRRALDGVADRVGRAGGMGRPILWRLRPRTRPRRRQSKEEKF